MMFFRRLRLDSCTGVLLIFATVIAIAVANGPFANAYLHFLHLELGVSFTIFTLKQSVNHWVNDGFMVLFFFLIGLELKREIQEGDLKKISNIFLPLLGAIGGMLVPALIYLYINFEHPNYWRGWAIPAATDIAFALGILGLLGRNLPKSWRIFLLSLAIFDDIGAIVIIALFYNNHLNLMMLLFIMLLVSILLIRQRHRVFNPSVFFILSILLWLAFLHSGLHATLSGVILAFFVPNQRRGLRPSVLHYLEKKLQPFVSFCVLPIFALVNCAIPISLHSSEQILHPVPFGISVALFLGKPLGVFGFCALALYFQLLNTPKHITYLALFGLSMLCGIGFTMSLFISVLAFDPYLYASLFDPRLGVLLGSLLSAVVGVSVLLFLKWQYLKRKNT